MHSRSFTLRPISHPIDPENFVQKCDEGSELFDIPTIYFICKKHRYFFTKAKFKKTRLIEADFQQSPPDFKEKFKIWSKKRLVFDYHRSAFAFDNVQVENGEIIFLSNGNVNGNRLVFEDIPFSTAVGQTRPIVNIINSGEHFFPAHTYEVLYVGRAKKGVIERFSDGHHKYWRILAKRIKDQEIYVHAFQILQGDFLLSNIDVSDELDTEEKKEVERQIHQALNHPMPWQINEAFLDSLEQALIWAFGGIEYLENKSHEYFPTPGSLFKTMSVSDINVRLEYPIVSFRGKFGLFDAENAINIHIDHFDKEVKSMRR